MMAGHMSLWIISLGRAILEAAVAATPASAQDHDAVRAWFFKTAGRGSAEVCPALFRPEAGAAVTETRP
jgi:hypothetical protein